jgi:hypothetical protein
MEIVMLHTSKPEAYLTPETLNQPGKCPDCGALTVLALGVMHLGHFNFNGEPREGLIWTCSDRCFLSWEHIQFMGSA